MYHSNKIKKTFEIFSLHLINGICLAFVTWQSIQCMKNYNDKPQGTIVHMKKTSHVPFLAITVCGSSTFGNSFVMKQGKEKYFNFNQTFLNKTCGIRYLIISNITSKLTHQMLLNFIITLQFTVENKYLIP